MALIVAYVITVLALFGIAFVMLKLQPDAGTTELLILAVYVLSCFAGGWYAGRRAGQRKFLQGLLVGVLYFAVLFLISGMGEREIQSDLASGRTWHAFCAQPVACLAACWPENGRKTFSFQLQNGMI